MLDYRTESRIRSSYYIKRIQSIIRLHILLFDGPLLGFGKNVKEEYTGLLDFFKRPVKHKLERILSILKLHELLFGLGYLESNPDVLAEMPGLYRYVTSLAAAPETELKKSNILPQNLGTSFLRKQLGAPLFGLYRPNKVPRPKGVLLLHQAIEADGVGKISAMVMDGKTHIRYQNLGAEIQTASPWLYCRISRTGEMPILLPSAAYAKKEPTVFTYEDYSLFLAASKVKTSSKKITMDPFLYQYAYFFYDDMYLIPKMQRFLIDLLLGMYVVPERDAEQIVGLFIQRLL